jgi:hypothetical protein
MQKPGNALALTASRRTTLLSMTSALSLAAARDLIWSRCSRTLRAFVYVTVWQSDPLIRSRTRSASGLPVYVLACQSIPFARSSVCFR